VFVDYRFNQIGGDDANVGASSLSMQGFAAGWML